MTRERSPRSIQVNGKLRATLDYRKDCTDEELEELKKKALALEKIQPFLEGKTIVKVIAVKNRIVNIVVR